MRKRVNIALDPMIHEKGVQYAKRRGMSFSALITVLINDFEFEQRRTKKGAENESIQEAV